MWVFTPAGGFVSVVRKREDAARGTVTIRARVKQDLVDLRQFVASMGPIESGAGSDYEHRVVVAAADFEAGMAAMARAVTYSNFKDEVSRVKGAGRARAYHTIWGVLRKLQRP